MGFRAEFSGLPLGSSGRVQVIDYTVEESASPLSTGDTSGSVGTFSLTIPVPDTALVSSSSIPSPMKLVDDMGVSILTNRIVTIFDSRAGITLGTSKTATLSQDGGTISVTGESRLGELNVFGIQAQPFSGTLQGAFDYYVGLAGITTNVSVDPSIASRTVRLPGWNGELWFHLKMLAASQDCEITLVSGIIYLRPVRTRVAIPGRDTLRSKTVGGGALAQAVEVYLYETAAFGAGIQAWPPPASTLGERTIEVLNVNAGETSEYTLDISEFASLSAVSQPTMGTSQGPGVYTIVGDDGIPVLPAMWAARGGSLSVRLAPSTTEIIVTLRGATGVPTTSGNAASANFSVALASDTSGSRYSTLNILGTGIRYNKSKVRISTGIPATVTATDIGVTIDNPFITTVNSLYNTGTRAAKAFTGSVPTLSGEVTALNRRGDTGSILKPTYSWVQTELIAAAPPATYALTQTYILANLGTTYRAVETAWIQRFRGDDDQLYGNAAGVRIFDKKSRRWYRSRQATISPTGVSISTADDDLIYSDFKTYYGTRTYGTIQTRLTGLTYADQDSAGLWGF